MKRFLAAAYVTVLLILVGVFMWGDGALELYLIILASVLVLRLAVQWKVSRMMSAHADDRSAGPLPELDSPDLPSRTQPSLVEVDATTENDAGEVAREFLVRRARKLFRLGLLRDAIASCAFLLIPISVSLLLPNLVPDYVEPGSRMDFFPLACIILLIIVLVRFLFYRKQFRPLDADFGASFAAPQVIFVRELSRPRAYSFLVAGLFLYLSPELLSPIGAVQIAVFAAYFLLLWRWTPAPAPNIRLLVLRVFGVDKNALFTFGRLLEFWQHFGNYFTVVDPAYLKYHYRFLSPRSAAVGVVLAAIALSLEPYVHPGDVDWLPGVVTEWLWEHELVPAALVATILMIAVEYRLIARRMVQSREDLHQRLIQVRARPHRNDLTFKSMPTPCYANTWRVAVAEFVKESDVVLMDLRGFSTDREGCEYEVDFLFDTISIERVLFLVDADVDRALIRRLVLERWEDLREKSPNRGLAAPELRIYAATEQDERDVQGIMDELIRTAASSGRLNVSA